MQTKTNGNGHRKATRNPIKRQLDLSIDSLALGLIKTPTDIDAAQRKYDELRIELDGHVAAVSLRALTEPLFRVTAKDGGEDSWRAASNDIERRVALDQTLNLDAVYVELRLSVDAARRDLELCRNRFKGMLAAAKLIVAK